MKPKTIIIGAAGQVGRVLFIALCKQYDILEHDRNLKRNKKGEMKEITVKPEGNEGLIMHICIPYSDDFIGIVKRYNEVYKPKLIIIHSTLKVGTTIKLVNDKVPCVHSPIIYDDEQLHTSVFFNKMIGYDLPELGLMAHEHLRPCFNTSLINGTYQTELADCLLGLYHLTCRAVTFEMGVIFKILKLDYSVMMELIGNNNSGYASFQKYNHFLQNMVPILNKEDYRLKLINLLPENLTSDFFKLAVKSYGLEKESAEKIKHKDEKKENEKPTEIQESGTGSK